MSPVRSTWVPPHSSRLKIRRPRRALVAVLFAEQRHRAGLQGLVEIHHVGVHFAVGEDLLIDQPLDFGQLVLVHRRVMRRIESQARRFDDAAGLFDVRTQDRAQRLHAAGACRCDCAWWRWRDSGSTCATTVSPTFSART